MKPQIKNSIIIVLGILIFLFCVRYLASVGFQPIKSMIFSVANQVPQHYVLASALFLALFIASIMIIPFVPIFGVVGSYLFGPFVGFVYTVCACIIGSLLSFFMFQFLFARYMSPQMRQKYQAYEERIKEHGASYLLMLQFSGVVPYSFINALAVFSHISLFTVLWTTILGSIPSAIVYALAGGQLRTLERLDDIVSWRMMGVLALCALAALAPLGIKFLIKHFHKNKSQ